MRENDAANITPGSGNGMTFNESSTRETYASSSYHPKQGEEQETPQRVLIVEDDISLATLEAEVLTAHGFQVTVAGNGEQAITTLHQSIPDLVVLDLELPNALSGWDVLHVLRTLTRIPVILATSSETDVRRYRHLQGETRLTLDYLPKPYPMQILLKRVRRILMIVP